MRGKNSSAHVNEVLRAVNSASKKFYVLNCNLLKMIKSLKLNH